VKSSKAYDSIEHSLMRKWVVARLVVLSLPIILILSILAESSYNFLDMNILSRSIKQILVVVVFFLILGGLGFLIYSGTNKPTPTPTPNPTINLAPLQVILTKLFNVQSNDYDFLAKVNNPNQNYGSADVEYQITFYDSAGAQLSAKTGSFYILPGQTRYIIDSPLSFQAPLGHADFKVKSVEWQKLNSLTASGVSLVVKNATYVQVSSGGVFSKAGGSILNNSDFDLNQVEVTLVVIDNSGAPIAVNQTEINTFLARTTRGFEVTWFSPFVGQVSRVEAEATTDVFENSNFLQQYGGQERFKQLY
jgi:hypothetical protein